MNLIRNSNTLALLLGGMWSIVISVLISVAMSFLTGLAFKPNLINSAALGTIAGVLFLHLPNRSLITLITILACFLLEFPKMETIWISEKTTRFQNQIYRSSQEPCLSTYWLKVILGLSNRSYKLMFFETWLSSLRSKLFPSLGTLIRNMPISL